MYLEYRSTLPLERWDRSFTQEESENLWIQRAGEPIRGSVYGYSENTYQKNTVGIVVHHPLASMAGIKRIIGNGG